MRSRTLVGVRFDEIGDIRVQPTNSEFDGTQRKTSFW